MRRSILALAALLAVVGVLASGYAGAATVRVGKLVLTADGSYHPQTLPRRAYAPIHLQGYGRVTTTDGSVPPALEHVKVDFDRDGKLTTTGLPVCPPSRIEVTTVSGARQRCRGAIVGRGHVGATISLPGLDLKVRSPLTLFNGPPRNGNPTVVAHAQTTVPIFESYVVVAPIERRRGTFGYRSSFDIPPIAGGLGSLTSVDAKIGRRYRFRGSKRSYLSARCSDRILQAQGYFSFADGTVVYGSVFKVCRIRRP
jgi:hypothetical protein